MSPSGSKGAWPLDEPFSQEGAPPITGWRKTFTSLHSRNYRYFYMGQGTSLVGSWTRSAALSWLAWIWTKSEFMTGLVSFMNTLPILLFALYAGSLADRHPKLSVFRATSWFALLSSTTFGVILLLGHHASWLLLLFAALWGTAMAFEMPSRQALIVELVGPKDLSNAIALNSAMVNASRVLGPPIAGFLLSTVGAAWCFLVDAASYIAVLFGISRIRIAETSRTKGPGSTWAHLRIGLDYVVKDPLLARTFGLLMVMSLGGWSYQSQLAPFVSKTLHQEAAGYGWIMAMNGLGACTGALLVAFLHDKLKTQFPAYLGTLIFSICIILVGFQTHPLGAAFFLFFAGFGLILFFSTSNSFLHTHCPNELRGRVMGLWALVFGGGTPLGILLMGLLAEKYGSAQAFQSGALFCLLAGSAVYFIGKRPRR